MGKYHAASVVPYRYATKGCCFCFRIAAHISAEHVYTICALERGSDAQ
jgi:hypothetical protein